jgi:hypothetical protein
MGHRAVIARYTADGSPLVIPEQYADRLAGGPWDQPPIVGDAPPGHRRSVRVCPLLAGDPSTQLSDELSRQGDDVVVVLLTHDPAELPVGPLLDELLRYGHHVVEATPVTSRVARAVIVVTRDREVPRAAYLLGTPLSGDDAIRRALAEFAVEGLATRAQRTREKADVAAMTEDIAAMAEDVAAMAEDVARWQQRATDAEKRAGDAEKVAAELTERVAAIERNPLQAWGRNARRSVGRATASLRDGPVRTARRAGHAVVGWIRRRD